MFTKRGVPRAVKQRYDGRQIALVDIENVLGGAVLNARAARWAKRSVEEVVAIKPDAHVVIGTSHVGFLAVGCAWPDKRYVLGSGPDGADLALMEVLAEDISGRFSEIVLVSGDGIFAGELARLAANGVEVTVVAHPDGLSNRLKMAARHVTYLTEHYNPSTVGGAA